MVDAVAAVPAVAPAEAVPMGDLFQSYDPVGALNGMFAPAFIRGFQPSEAAVGDWNAVNRGMTRGLVDELRMPAAWQDPTAGVMFPGGAGPYGAGGIPTNQTHGDPRGEIDPMALRALAQGGKYDVQGRRDAIAARVMANETAKTAWEEQQAKLAANVPTLAPQRPFNAWDSGDQGNS